MSERTIENVRKYNIDPKEVIAGLNGYYESDKRNSYITVRRNDVEGPVYFTAALYLSALIEWLRVDHDIFYYPGMDIRDSVESGLTLDQVEAARNAAKMCCLRGRFSLIEQKDRYVSDRIRSSCKAHGVIIDATLLTTSDWSLLVTFLCDEVEKLKKKEVEDAKKEAKRECYWYLLDALKKLSPECDALKIDHYEDLVDRIFYEISLINGNCKQCQRKHTTEKLSYIRRANKAEEEVKKLNDVIKKLRELLNEISKEEDEGWFKP